MGESGLVGTDEGRDAGTGPRVRDAGALGTGGRAAGRAGPGAGDFGRRSRPVYRSVHLPDIRVSERGPARAVAYRRRVPAEEGGESRGRTVLKGADGDR
ncbi:hypothetical protein GCM10017559_26730 [Streptosporangium longisporum]|uniref:Uncharacterized protein n=1 Tax=Streptosporangium longisporum TaxID=46187 RepID=A0ABP6KDJ8_9ACTN